MIRTKSLPGDLDAELRARAKQEPSLRGFAYCVSGLGDLGSALGAALASYLEPGEIPQRVVVLPKQRLLQTVSKVHSRYPLPTWKQTPEVILLHTSNRLLAAAILDGSRLDVTSTLIDNIITIQLGTILLFSWFEWSYVSEGKLETARVYFNTVSDYIFRDLQQCLSLRLVQRGGQKAISQSQGLEHLAKLPFKFRNIIPLRLLLPNEEIQSVVYSPGVWEPRFVLLKRQTRPTTALVITDKQVIMAEEELGRGAGHYGVIARYIPRHRLHRVVLEEMKEGLLLCLVFLIQGVEFEQQQKFEFLAKNQLDRLLNLIG